MATIDFSPLYRSAVGYDGLANILDSAFKSESAGFPHYDIVSNDENQYTITLAVPGYVRAELEVNLADGVLTISGERKNEEPGEYLHKGIPNNKFERRFSLADTIEVTGADLTDGLLTVQLHRHIPEALKPKAIEIGSGGRVLEHQTVKKKAV